MKTSKALVLGGGGSTGNAWLIGVMAGLFQAGLDVTAADLTIGTSAGATAAAQIAGLRLAELFDVTVSAPVPRRPAVVSTDHLGRFKKIIADSTDAADMRRRMGRLALEPDADAQAKWQEHWRATVAARVPGASWPARRVLITAVDAASGEPCTFERDSGVDLVDAVAASCAGGGFAYRINNRYYIDGGYRANPENADLAERCGRVLVLSPLGGRSLYPAQWGTHLAAQVEALQAAGSRVETVFPDQTELFVNPMDFSLRPAAARVGYEQGSALAGRLRTFWG